MSASSLSPETLDARALLLALGYAQPALEYLAEEHDLETCSRGDDDLCGHNVCDECGCIAAKLELANAALRKAGAL